MVDYAKGGEFAREAKRTITIPANIEKFSIVGPNDTMNGIVFQDLSIIVAYRETPLIIELENISFIGQDQSALFVNSIKPVSQYLKGNIELSGADNYDAIQAKKSRYYYTGDSVFKWWKGY